MTNTMYMDRADKNKIGVVTISDIRFIPVIFVPGVMGSNLMEKAPNEEPKEGSNKKTIWRYDGSASLLGWSLPSSGPAERKKLLHPDKVQVDNRGIIALPLNLRERQDKALAAIPSDPSIYDAERYVDEVTKAEKDDPEFKLFGDRRSRGWGEVAYASYGEFLDKLQTELFNNKPNKKNQTLAESYQRLVDKALGLKNGIDSLERNYIDTISPYQFPVHAVGYNWLNSNMISAERLKNKIEEIIRGYQNKKIKCNKVIIVTHSMGGLVSRYYTQCLGGEEKVYGVVHGVMPSIGAAATYTRMKSGTENTKSSMEGYIISHILGRNAAELVAICSQSSGPLELLPTPEYDEKWLKITDRHGNERAYPTSNMNVYTKVYLNRNDWWKLMDENLLNPLKTDQVEYDWQIFSELVITHVERLHEKIKGKYHPNTYSFYGKALGDAIPDKYLTQQSVIWTGTIFGGSPEYYNNTKKWSDGRLDIGEIYSYRTIEDVFTDKEKAFEILDDGNVIYKNIGQRYKLRGACENGDGTVPVCSGKIIHDTIKERLAIEVEHEAAYRNELSQAFTLRSIIKIAQEVTKDDEMVFNE